MDANLYMFVAKHFRLSLEYIEQVSKFVVLATSNLFAVAGYKKVQFATLKVIIAPG